VENASCLTVVTFCVTDNRQRWLTPAFAPRKSSDENDSKGPEATAVPIEVDESRSLSLPLQANQSLSTGRNICTVPHWRQDRSRFHQNGLKNDRQAAAR
jgi:hypothetical protein